VRELFRGEKGEKGDEEKRGRHIVISFFIDVFKTGIE
jgi:hypothetical protein